VLPFGRREKVPSSGRGGESFEEEDGSTEEAVRLDELEEGRWESRMLVKRAMGLSTSQGEEEEKISWLATSGGDKEER